MISMTLAEAAEILGLSVAKDATFTGLSIDTRTLQPGNLYIAIKGERVDGHDFIEQAKEKGAAAALVSHHVGVDIPQLIVSDITKAMGLLGSAWRKEFDIPFIAVTGSNGKTSTKNMVASIMLAACNNDEDKVLATKGTLNNHYGMPLTLARLSNKHRYAVIEMGMNHFGEIEYLTGLAKPNVAIITNAAAAHLEGVGSLDGVAKAKAEIFTGLPDYGVAILNKDDHYYDYWREQIGKSKHISFGFSSQADVSVDAGKTENNKQHIFIKTPAGDFNVALPLLGKHNIANALAATAASIAVGIDNDEIKHGLENLKATPGRLDMHTLSNGVNIIDDTYNANPYSLKAAVDTLATFNGKKILVLGDMGELGDNAQKIHSEAGEEIRHAGIDYLFTFGKLTANTAQAFGDGAFHFNEQEKLIDALKPFLHNTTTILVKGSRSMKMENVLNGLVA